MRTFLALPLDPAAVASAIAVQRVWRRQWPEGAVNWVPPENLHVTLRFLGQIAETLVDPVADALSAAASCVEPLALSFDRASSFEGRGRPPVLVLEGTAAEGLASLVRELDARLGELGLGVRDRPFRAHLTMGRARRRGPAGSPPELGGPIDWIAERAALFRSFTEPEGSRYVALREVQLGRAGTTMVEAPEGD